FGGILELDEGRDHRHRHDVGPQRQAVLGLVEPIGTPVDRFRGLSHRAGRFIELQRHAIGEAQQGHRLILIAAVQESRDPKLQPLAAATTTALKSQIAGLRETTENKSPCPTRWMLLARPDSPMLSTELVEGAISLAFCRAPNTFLNSSSLALSTLMSSRDLVTPNC